MAKKPKESKHKATFDKVRNRDEYIAQLWDGDLLTEAGFATHERALFYIETCEKLKKFTKTAVRKVVKNG